MHTGYRPVDRVCNQNLIFLFLNQKICCGWSKELSQWDGSFEHIKHMFKFMGKEYSQFSAEYFYLSRPMGLLFGVFMGWQLQYMKLRLSVNTHSGFILHLNNSVDPGQLACKEAS